MCSYSSNQITIKTKALSYKMEERRVSLHTIVYPIIQSYNTKLLRTKKIQKGGKLQNAYSKAIAY